MQSGAAKLGQESLVLVTLLAFLSGSLLPWSLTERRQGTGRRQ